MNNRLLTLLRGHFVFVRRIEFLGNSFQEDMLVQGTADWNPSPTASTSLLYEEQGLMTPMNPSSVIAPSIPVRASHEWRFTGDIGDSSSAEVFFYPEIRHFYTISLSGDGPAFFKHHCSPDTYSGSFQVLKGGTAIRLDWDVHGPKKNYRISTMFERAATRT